MNRPSSAAALLLMLATVGGAASAQAEAAATVRPITFTTADGSRFVLVPDADQPLVHWAIATMADDPPGFAGLSAATMVSALAGTWSSGSRDGERERRALDELDAAFHAWLANRADVAAGERFASLSATVEQLSDPSTHGRILASVPMYGSQVFDRPPVCLYATTSVPTALESVARRLFERREQTALRDLQTNWVEVVFARVQRRLQDERTALRTEVLALAMPDHPLLPLLEQPGMAAPRRSAAMATWQTMQRPERTVHVLYGGFDAETVQAMLERRFDTTSLPPAPPQPPMFARPIASLRRSMVPGVATPTVALAYVLPPDIDRTVLEVATRWLGAGADSRLGQELPRLGHKRATVSCLAPWPATIGGQSLLLLEVADPDGIAGLTDVVRKAITSITSTLPSAAALQNAMATLQREVTTTSNDPRQFTVSLAEAALLWPGQPPRTNLPNRIEGPAVRQLLTRVFATQPVVVEGRP